MKVDAERTAEPGPEQALPRAAMAAPAPARVLAMQRQIGNRATGRVLARYQLEGPFDWNDPVHEVLTLMALKGARERIKDAGQTAGTLLSGIDTSKLPSWDSASAHNLAPEKLDKSVQQFVRGVVWADDPKGYLFDDDSGTEDYSSSLMWNEEFDADEKDEREELIARSHYGDLQFFHAMATKDAESASATKAKILEWARFLIGVAKGDIAHTTKLKDLPLTSRLFDAFPEYTIAQLFVYKAGSATDIRQRALGTLFHVIQDSFAKGHVERDADKAVVQFHSYEHQDHGEHGKYDAWAAGKTLRERVDNTHGAATAVDVCARAAQAIDQNLPTDDIVKWFDETVFKLSASATAAGAGADFKKK